MPVDLATNPPVASYYTGRPVMSLRFTDSEQFEAEIRKRKCVTAGVDYYALTGVINLNFPELYDKLGNTIGHGGVAYMKICWEDTTFKFTLLGYSDGELEQ
jgi:hypothetical protein